MKLKQNKGKQMIRKLLLGLVVSTSIVMANDVAQDDLLSLATTGKTAGTSLEMNNSDMEKADGGYSSPTFTIKGYHQNNINRVQNLLTPPSAPKSNNTTPSPYRNLKVANNNYKLNDYFKRLSAFQNR